MITRYDEANGEIEENTKREKERKLEGAKRENEKIKKTINVQKRRKRKERKI